VELNGADRNGIVRSDFPVVCSRVITAREAIMGLFAGKKGLVFGIANDHSIAWAITAKLHAEGADMGFTHLPDKDPARARMEHRVRKLVEPLGAKLITPCDVQKDEDLDRVFAQAREIYGTLDFVIHSVAYAPIEDLKGQTVNCSRAGFGVSMDISVYSLLAITKRAKDILNPGGSILTLTYLGGEKVIPGYNIMGVCKAALESSVTYLAHELGPMGFRVNGLSAGPIKTLSSSAVGDIDVMYKLYDAMSPLRRNVNVEEVGKSGMYLLSDLASGVTGEILHVDSGFHIMGAPPADAKL
jgi:enoyl-[acyl-carrier protein] reductase I